MVTSGLRGFFAQVIELGMADVIVTTVGAIEEDIMKSFGERFSLGSFDSDDVELNEQGINRVGNIMIKNDELFFIDYQGGRRGALHYDVASFLYDAKANIPHQVRDELLEHYLLALSQKIKVDSEEFKKYLRKIIKIDSLRRV